MGFDDNDESYIGVQVHIKSVKLPKLNKEATYYRPYPTATYYNIRPRMPELEWGYVFIQPYYLCLGEYEERLADTEDWFERVQIVGEYLQVTIPDSGGTRNRTQWAYGIGLVGKEVIQTID